MLSTSPAFPLDETPAGARVIDRYYVPVMTQELSWALGHAEFPERSLVSMPRGLVSDLQLPQASRSVELARARERRAQLSRYFARANAADVFVIDLSRIDGSFDREVELILNGNPPDWFARRFPERFEYRIWNHEDCLAALRRLCALLLELDGERRVVLVVNPHSVSHALSPSDITCTAVRTHALWISAATQVAAEMTNVAYYPLFETLTWPDRSGSFDGEGHVLAESVDSAVGAMLHAFGVYVERTTEGEFDEAAYLRARPDVAAGVQAGDIESGYYHWFSSGRPRASAIGAAVAESEEFDRASLGVRIAATVPERAPSARRFRIDVELTNTGTSVLETAGSHPVAICYRWYTNDGEWIEIGQSLHTPLFAPIVPGESAVQSALVGTPKSAGRYVLALTLVKQNVAWFDDLDAGFGQRSEVVIEGWDPDLPD